MIATSAPFTTANAILAKIPIYLITIAGYSRVFTNVDTGVGGQYDWIESIEDHSITINDLDGGADLGQFVFTVQDRGAAITGDFPSFIFEGKTVTVKTGFPGMLQSDFALLFTGKVDSVASANGNEDYTFTCVDNKDVLTKVIYTTGDDGRPTDQDHPRTLNAHPIDILIAILQTEIGLATTEFNIGKLEAYKQGIFAGAQFTFSIDSPPAAKDFIEQQIMKPLGGYIWTNNRGQVDFNFFRRDNRPPVTSSCMVAAFTDGTGQIVSSPFLVAITTGVSMTIQAPPGATLLSFGCNDFPYSDNIGAWNITVNGSGVSVPGATRPWNISGVNSAFPIVTTGSTAPVTTAVTAGTLYTLAYISGTVQKGVGDPFVDPRGIDGSDGVITNAPGDYTVSIGTPITTPDFILTNDNMEEIPEAEQADLINTVSFRFDKNAEGKFAAESVLSYTLSVARYGQYGQQIIESDGMRSGFQGFFLAAFTARMIFFRYGLKNLQFEELPCLWTAAVLEPGDLIAMTSANVPDREAGVMGITSKLFEVLDRTWHFSEGTVSFKLLDASYLLNIGQFLVAPNGIPDFTSASTYQKNRYMFLCNNSDQYSDTTAGHPLG